MKKNALSITLISMMGLLTACGSPSDSMAKETPKQSSEPPVAQPVSIQPLPEAESNEKFNSKVARGVKNPVQMLEPSVNQIEQKLLKSSDISFSVEDLIKTTQHIENYVQESGGYIEQKYINYTVQDRKTNTKSNGEVEVFEKITPQAQMIVRVPNPETTKFLNRIVPLMANFYTQNYEAKQQDFMRLMERQKTLADMQASQLSTDNKIMPPSIPPDLQQLIEKEIKQRLEFSTITLNFHQNAMVRQTKDFDLQGVIKSSLEPFSTRLAKSMGLGWKGVVSLFVYLMVLWPIYVLLAVGLWGRYLWKKRQK